MKAIQVLPLGNVHAALLAGVSKSLSEGFAAACEILDAAPDPTYAWNVERQQYSSTQILATLAARRAPLSTKTLGIIAADLYIPILTFVFGEAQLDGTCAIASTFRLRQEFYGLPANPGMLLSRLVKESTHELGHTLGLRHCENFECAMAPSHSIEWVDLKKARLCPSCSQLVASLKP